MYCFLSQELPISSNFISSVYFIVWFMDLVIPCVVYEPYIKLMNLESFPCSSSSKMFKSGEQKEKNELNVI